MPNDSAALTVLVDQKFKRFCADCAQMMDVSQISLNRHCDMKHGGRVKGFLLSEKNPIRCMYENFDEFLEDQSMELMEKDDYEWFNYDKPNVNREP